MFFVELRPDERTNVKCSQRPSWLTPMGKINIQCQSAEQKFFGDVVAVQACSGTLLGARPDFNSLNASKPCHRNRVAIEMLNNVLFRRTDHSARKEVVDDAPTAAAYPARAAAKGSS